MKTYWVIYDDFGCFNFFDSVELYRHARKHIHGLMEYDTHATASFKAESVAGCWKAEDVLKWQDGEEKAE